MSLTVSQLLEPGGEVRADDDAARWAWYRIGAFPCRVDTGRMHGPDRPAVIAERFECPSCGAAAAEPCRLGSYPQRACHVARHREAQRALWRALRREMSIDTGWTLG